MRSRRAQERERELLRRKEEGFNSNVQNDRMREYNALQDQNMRHYFENKQLQSHLLRAGLIDRAGRVIDYEKNKARLAIIEQEFKQAEKAEALRKKEEEDLRRRIQLRRQQAIEQARRDEKLRKLKEDSRLRTEIVHLTRETQSPCLRKTSSKSFSAPVEKKKKKVVKKKKAVKKKAIKTSDSDEDDSHGNNLGDDFSESFDRGLRFREENLERNNALDLLGSGD